MTRPTMEMRKEVKVPRAMIEAALRFAEDTLQYYPISDASIYYLVEGILERALAVRSTEDAQK